MGIDSLALRPKIRIVRPQRANHAVRPFVECVARIFSGDVAFATHGGASSSAYRRVGTLAAAAVHFWREDQVREAWNVSRTAHGPLNRFVVPDAILRRRHRVGPSVIQNQLAAVAPETRSGRDRRRRGGQRRFRPGQIANDEIERARIPAGVSDDPIAPEIESRRLALAHETAGPSARAAHRFYLGGRRAGRRVLVPAQARARVERAAPRIRDRPSFNPSSASQPARLRPR